MIFVKSRSLARLWLIDECHNMVGDVLDGLPFHDQHFDMVVAQQSFR